MRSLIVPLVALLLAAPAQAADSTAHTATRPLSLVLEIGLANPTGIYGGRLGWSLGPRLGLEAGGGLGMGGYQATAMVRRYRHLGGSDSWALTGASGPSVGISSAALGFEIAHAEGVEVDQDDLFYIAWLSAEGGIEWRSGAGALFRMQVGAAATLAENQSHLCAGVETGGEAPRSDCNPAHLASRPELASRPWTPYVQLSYGWAF